VGGIRETAEDETVKGATMKAAVSGHCKQAIADIGLKK
jgi:hypothetical protein